MTVLNSSLWELSNTLNKTTARSLHLGNNGPSNTGLSWLLKLPELFTCGHSRPGGKAPDGPISEPSSAVTVLDSRRKPEEVPPPSSLAGWSRNQGQEGKNFAGLPTAGRNEAAWGRRVEGAASSPGGSLVPFWAVSHPLTCLSDPPPHHQCPGCSARRRGPSPPLLPPPPSLCEPHQSPGASPLPVSQLKLQLALQRVGIVIGAPGDVIMS